MKNNRFKAILTALLLCSAVLWSTGCGTTDSIKTNAGVHDKNAENSAVKSESTISSAEESNNTEKETSTEQNSDNTSVNERSSEISAQESTDPDEYTSSGKEAEIRNESSEEQEASTEESGADPALVVTESETEPVIDSIVEQRRQMEESVDQSRLKIAQSLYKNIISEELTEDSAQIKTELISQYPELPTGCESVALTMALNSLGFGLKKTDIAEKYLPYGYSCITSFVGDPTTYDGAGIFPPGLTYCANNIIKERTNKYYALDTTGTKLDDLFKLIENGCPVVVWSTLYLGEPYFTDDYESYNGHDYPWYTNEHCIVLYGYDTEKNTVQVCDSRAGDVEYNADWFERIHNETGMMSLSIIVM